MTVLEADHKTDLNNNKLRFKINLHNLAVGFFLQNWSYSLALGSLNYLFDCKQKEIFIFLTDFVWEMISCTLLILESLTSFTEIVELFSLWLGYLFPTMLNFALIHLDILIWEIGDF